MKNELDSNKYQLIAKEIHSDMSPVGIDAKKTHILILLKLESLAEQLTRIEERVSKLEEKI